MRLRMLYAPLYNLYQPLCLLMMSDGGDLMTFIPHAKRMTWIPYFLFLILSDLPHGSILLLVITSSQSVILLNPVIIAFQVDLGSIDFGSATTAARVEWDGAKDGGLLRCNLRFGFLIS